MFVQFHESNLLLIGLFALFCILACGYNLVKEIFDRRLQTRLKLKATKIAALVREYSEKTPHARMQDDRFSRELIRKLHGVNGMIVMDMMLDALKWDEDHLPSAHMRSVLRPVCIKYARRYRFADDGVRGFVLQLIRRCGVESLELDEFLMRTLGTRSTYLRGQAIYTLAHKGDADLMVNAFKRISASEHNVSTKLFTDMLMQFRGNHAALGEKLIAEIKGMSVDVQCAIVGYAQSIKDENLSATLLELFDWEELDKELRIALLKYFGAVHDDRAYGHILKALNEEEWEYVAMASKAAPLYQTDELTALLKDRLSHQNWFVRYNCAMALVKMLGRRKEAFADVLAGPDRYARDIIGYALEGQASGGN